MWEEGGGGGGEDKKMWGEELALWGGFCENFFWVKVIIKLFEPERQDDFSNTRRKFRKQVERK